MDADQVTGELYGLEPSQFVRTRDERVRQARAAGDRVLAATIAKLRKPSVAAWLVNLLVRSDREEVEQLLALGEALREAQSSLAGPELRELGRQRHQVVAALARRARRLAADAGHRVSAGTDEEVQATLTAALADPGVAEQVRSGRLTSALTYEGLGFAAGAAPAAGRPAAAGTGGPAKVHDLQRERAQRAERRAREEAERRARAAEEEVAQAQAAVQDAERRAEQVHERLSGAERSVRELEEALAHAREQHEVARREVQEVGERLHREHRALAKAEQRLAAARRELPPGR